MTSPIEDEFTELVDADIPRVDLVDKAANGTTFLIAKQADGAGLLSPDLVRDLIGKTAEPEPAREDTVTMTGSPGAIAKLMYEAAQRARERDEVAKAEKSTKAINDLPDSDFAYIESGGGKDDEGKTVPRSLRHFPIMDAAHVRNALSRAPQSPFGDKAMPKIRAAAKKFGIDVAKEALMDDDALDPAVALAEPDIDAPGMDTDPGSPAWEAIDAATACKWTAILARARNAIDLLAEREMLEAASADPDDAENAFDLQDACCAIDYAISVLAPFAVAEQAEAERGDDMAAVGKALNGWDAAPLDTIEALGHVRKAGRVLSSANEAAIRGAVESLQKVLASLPAAPIEKEAGEPVAKTANEEADMPAPTTSDETTAASGQQPAMGSKEPEPKPEAGVPVSEVGKADSDGKPAVTVVYDQKGKLIGIVDPSDITPVSNSESDGSDDEAADDSGDPGSEDAADQTPDLTPQPPAEAGTPADAAPASGDDDGDVTKSTHNESDTTSEEELTKSSLLAAVEDVMKRLSATHTEQIVKTGDAVLELADLLKTLEGRVGALEEQPAEPRVFTNGAVPPAAPVLRGQDRGAQQIDMAKAAELKKELYRGATSGDQNAAAIALQELAIAQLREIHLGGARQ